MQKTERNEEKEMKKKTPESRKSCDGGSNHFSSFSLTASSVSLLIGFSISPSKYLLFSTSSVLLLLVPGRGFSISSNTPSANLRLPAVLGLDASSVSLRLIAGESISSSTPSSNRLLLPAPPPLPPVICKFSASRLRLIPDSPLLALSTVLAVPGLSRALARLMTRFSSPTSFTLGGGIIIQPVSSPPTIRARIGSSSMSTGCTGVDGSSLGVLEWVRASDGWFSISSRQACAVVLWARGFRGRATKHPQLKM
ncbi:hypothetical protein BZA05DRAFT_49758 [Tricharina praecox]|uniref:uncharacterized protein n=1 Tax=Tricharina praecox TaxID=43433 RepID=UPI00221E5F57|nr:uncharacterized protein BZA05DRAFT_49758 [Tricharina praecox]KAI5852019.1 hypothetical protein BZA05DRAFT_49758 [Tricharina praecox]